MLFNQHKKLLFNHFHFQVILYSLYFIKEFLQDEFIHFKVFLYSLILFDYFIH